MANLSMFKFLKNLFHRDYDENLGGTTIGSGSKDDSLHDVINGVLDSAEEKKNGILGSLFSSSSPLTALVNELTSYLHTLTRGQLTGAEREQNVFNAEQAAIQRGFEERMSSSAYQRHVADMQAAGINPAVAFGSGGASTPSGSVASGSASSGNPAAIFDLILGLQNMKLQDKISERQSLTNIRTSEIAADATVVAAKESAGVGHEANQIRREELAQRVEESKSRTALEKSQAKTEQERQNVLAKEALLHEATTYRIYQMVPYEQKFYDASTESEFASAEYAWAQAAYQNGLINQGVCEAYVRSLNSSATESEVSAEATSIMNNVKLGKHPEGGKSTQARQFVQWARMTLIGR